MPSTSTIELNSQALANNLTFLRTIFDEQVRISSVVKGNAYGHGLREFVSMAEEQGIDHFSVHSSDEARVVFESKNQPGTEIMIMGFLEAEDMAWAIENDISFFVFDDKRLTSALAVAKKAGKKARIHLELETGMNRSGFSAVDFDLLGDLLSGNENHFTLEGLCTHFAGAESIANHVRVHNQMRKFDALTLQLKKRGLIPKTKHTCCSAASIRLPEMHFDMVRIGILQYGFWPSREIFIEYLKDKKVKQDPLKRIISWKSSIMNTKQVEMGEFIGYGTTYLAQRDMRLAVIPVGYSHGFSRSLSNQGRVIIDGFRVPVVGMVNMNSMTVDISEIPEAHIGQEVTLIGSQEEVEISVSAFSELSEQLNYELLTRLPERIPREVITP